MVNLFSLRALLWAAAYCQRVIRKFKPVFVVVVILLAFPERSFFGRSAYDDVLRLN